MSDEQVIALVDAALERHGRERHRLVPVLLDVQAAYRWLPEAALLRIVERSDCDEAQVREVVGFYHRLRTTPAGERRLRVCVGTACHVAGAPRIRDAFREVLGIAAGQDTDREQRFTIEEVGCLGCCSLAPAVQIDDLIFGNLSLERCPQVIAEVLRERAAPTDADHPEPVLHAATARLCRCPACGAAGAGQVEAALKRERSARQLPLGITEVACDGRSFQAPAVELLRDDGLAVRYGDVIPEQVPHLLGRHLRPAGFWPRLRARVGAVLDRLADPEAVTRHLESVREAVVDEGPQRRIVTEGAGQLPPLELDAYRAAGGFAALEQARAMTPVELTDLVDEAGLRGRGGGGFPTARKWRSMRGAGERWLICNADEGDPGAFMDRMLLESFPFRVLEGLAIAAHAVGATRAIVYVRDEYPEACRRLRIAVAAVSAAGLLNGLALEVVPGAGAFVCGEETALIAACEGRAAKPRKRPPYPSEQGIFGAPTLVQNVESLATLPWLLTHGAAAFRAIGTEGSPGTKTFALAGKVRRGGLVEVPMGTSIRQLVEEVGGGIPDGRAFKAVQIGGPAGGCLPASLADLPIDFDALREAGAIMGSGGLVVLDDQDCMVDVAHYFLAFTGNETCGKCAGCRDDTQVMRSILEKLMNGQGRHADLTRLEELCGLSARRSLCGLGRGAANPVTSALRHFRAEFEAHLEGRCPAGRCPTLIDYRVREADCIGCRKCAEACPVEAIAGRPYAVHEIDPETCTRCDACRPICPTDAIGILSPRNMM